MTVQEAYQSLVARLGKRYELQEARNISEWVMEYVTGQKRVDRLMDRDAPVPVAQQETLSAITSELETGKPLQYVLNEAWFAGMKLYVDENVLIPRPETEELVDWIIEENRGKAGLRILDVGTGSGCIAIALAKALPKDTVRAFDVSEPALNIAIRNAMLQG
ncbi:MAG TPA: HemK/PrmC family methyltransferase, partial [Chitinophagaceae bacterium]